MANISGNSRITDQIMDYYTTFGQNRDLEKFFRLRAANTTRSSSDGSIPAATATSDEMERRGCKVGRSMENLVTLKRHEEEQERGSKSADLLNASKESDGKRAEKPKPVEAKEVIVKETRNEKKGGRNFNFNLESVIEIKIPPVATVQQQPIVISPPQPSILAQAPVIHEISTAGTQTMPEARSVEQQTEEPIRPVLKQTKATLNPEDTIDTTHDVSPVSSVASNRHKLEWDSLGDVGYNSSDKFYFCGAADLNETEKRCLQKYFSKKGLNFDEKVVVVRNIQTPRKGNKKQQESSTGISKEHVKHKWQDVYHKYKEKYPNPSEISFSLLNPDAQSTPKVVSLQNVPQKMFKSTQTSLVQIRTKGIQAEHIVDTTDKQIGTETLSSTTNKTTSVCEQGEVAESFEFFSSPPSEPGESFEFSNKEVVVVPSSTGNSSKSSSDSTSSDLQQLLSGESGGNHSQKEYKFEDELRLGITLYNTIRESRCLPAKVKQSLIDKIFRKMQKNDPLGRTKEQLLRDCKEKKPKKQPVSGGDAEQSNEPEIALSGFDTIAESGKNSSTGQSSRGADEVIVEIVDQRDSPEQTETSSSQDPIIQNLQELSIKSNDARNPAHRSLSSSQKTSSSQPKSANHTARHVSQRTEVSTDKSYASDRTGDDRIRHAMQEYLKPMTNSEVEYANQQELKRSLQRAKECSKNLGRETASAPSSFKRDNILELFRKEKQSQLLKIEKKIEHLKTMKVLLLEEQKMVNKIGVDCRTTYPLDQKSKPRTTKAPDGKENVYENTEKRTKSAVSAPIYTSVHEETPSSRSNNGTEFSSGSRSESGWNSHYHMKKLIQNRSKLETPTSDESIATFIKTRKDKFIENYERHRRQMFEEQHHIYTKPYSGRQSKQDQYSNPDGKYSIRNISKPKSNLPRSEVFISSDSMSIPAANTLTNTTTHQYDIKSSRSSSDSVALNARPVATQTNTGSIMKTKPIFEAKSKISTSVQVPSQAEGCHCDCKCPCRHRSATSSDRVAQHTEIIDGSREKQDKQQQTKPNSIAYVITFQGDQPPPTEKEQVYQRSTSSGSSSGTTGATDLLPLKEQFGRNRPGTLMRLKERQKCINELNKLREERNKQRKRLLLLTSDDSLRRSDDKDRLPPPPLAQRRIFSSKAIRENTRRQVRKFPEVLRKKEIEKSNDLKRKNLIRRDMFNRNLQRKVLHGQVDLSNSVRVMRE